MSEVTQSGTLRRKTQLHETLFIISLFLSELPENFFVLDDEVEQDRDGEQGQQVESWTQCYKTFSVHNLRIFVIS
jgi:hypothetical protein